MSFALDAAVSWYSHQTHLAIFPGQGKRPLLPDGISAATADEAQILATWTQHPRAQICVPTGKTNRLLVVNVNGPEGQIWYEAQGWPETFCVNTSPGRYQYWFKLPVGAAVPAVAKQIAPEVDLHGEGSYVVGPFSFHHETHKAYCIERSVSRAAAPPSLLALCAAENPPEAVGQKPMVEHALEYALKGIPVFPMNTVCDGECSCGKQECKSPGKHPRITGWQTEATTDARQIRRWWNSWPSANIGMPTGHRTGRLVLDVDPNHGGDKSLFVMEEDHGKLPNTLEVSTGGGGRHLHFQQHELDIRNSGGELGPGLDIRACGGLVLLPPSLHKTGNRYAWANENPVLDMPKWLEEMLLNLKAAPVGAGRVNGSGEKIPHGERHKWLLSRAAGYRFRGDSEEMIFRKLLIDYEESCAHEPPIPEEKFREWAAWGAKKDTGPAGAMPPDSTDAQRRESPAEEEHGATAEIGAMRFEVLSYPTTVWKGTLYGEYAEQMTAGNFIPPEFFIESLKTCVGAIVGDRVRCDRDGGNLRQYTVIIGEVGKGKGTAVRRTTNQFSGSPQETGESSDYLRGEDSKSLLQKVGAVVCNPASDVGLFYAAAKCPRILLTPSEFSEFLSKTRIENSALPSILRELFDSTWFTPSTTSKRKAEAMPNRCLLGMLTTTQKKTFGDALAMHGGLGTGFLSRLTLVSSEETRTVASLREPDLGDWTKRLFGKLVDLERAPETITLGEEAGKLLDAWWRGLQAQREEEDVEILTRMNVLTLRNALHLAWLREAVKISAGDMEGAIVLGDYQLAQRRDLNVQAADNPLACHQAKILGFLKRHGGVSYRQIYNGVNAARVGTELHGRCIDGLVEDHQVLKSPSARKTSFIYHLARYVEEEQ